jgi:Ca-activated chloride channel homolog
MDFEHTWILLHLLWIIPLFGILVHYASVRRKKILKKIFGDMPDETQYSTLSKGRRYLRMWLLLASIILLVVAVARPRWGWRILPFSGRGRDLMIVLDVSKSMNSEDVKPTRLKHAKLFLRDLIKATPGDRYGLVAFAGSAFLDCPLTVDKTSLFQTLDETTTNSIPLGGTNIENALNTAITAFKAAEGGYRAIILITDGDELYGDSSKAIATLKRMKIPLFVVGVGDPTGDGLIKMTDKNGKMVLMRDSKGELVKSRLNEKQLKKLSTDTGGIYVRSTETDTGFKSIYKRVKNLVPKEYEKGNNKRPIERFHYPLFVAVLLLLIRFGIGERRKINGNSTLVMFVLLALLSSPAQAQKSTATAPGSPLAVEESIPQKKGDADKKKDKLTAVEVYNNALKLQNTNKTEEAAKLYQKAINMSDGFPEVRGKSFQNLGVITHKQARSVMQKEPDKTLEILNKTEEMYRESMRTDTHLKKVILNQQKLIDDRRLAKQIKKQQEEMKKKQQQAQKKTKEALKQQKKENQDKKKQDKKKDQQKQKKQDKQQKQQNQQNKKDQQQKQDNKQNKSQQQKKQDQNKKEQQQQNKNQQQQDQQNQKQKTEQKINEAQKAVEDLKKEAKKRENKSVEQAAQKAEEEIKKAKKEQKKGNGKKSEEHLKKALDKLGKADKKNENKNSDKQEKTGKDKKKDAKDKNKNKDKNKQDKNRKLAKQKPSEQQKGKKEKQEKEIDPRQAAALLEMMANDEKNLRDAIKENQKKNSRIRKVLKDW